MNVAIIPARGGSKRIPRKNIKLFCGKPIISYSIEAARESGLFDRIIVSTDDDEIAAVARNYGAETPFVRPPELSDDHADTNEVTAHALAWLAERGHNIELACCLYATAPFVGPDDLRRGHEALIATGKSFAFSATTYAFPPQRAIRILPGDGVAPIFPQWIDCRSQDLEEAHHDAGQFYWGRADAFRSGLPIFAAHSVAVVVPRHRVQDIDTPEDWKQAELMFASFASTANVVGAS